MFQYFKILDFLKFFDVFQEFKLFKFYKYTLLISLLTTGLPLKRWSLPPSPTPEGDEIQSVFCLPQGFPELPRPPRPNQGGGHEIQTVFCFPWPPQSSPGHPRGGDEIRLVLYGVLFRSSVEQESETRGTQSHLAKLGGPRGRAIEGCSSEGAAKSQ